MSQKVLIFHAIPPLIPEIREMLSTYKAEIIIGATGLDCFKQTQQNKPSVVILDMKMPNLNGVKCCQQIKEMDDSIKVLLVSQEETSEALHEGLQAGCDFFAFYSNADQKLGAYLYGLFRGGEVAVSDKRKFSRFETRGFIIYGMETQRKEGTLINLGKGGILFLALENLSPPTFLQLELISPLGETLKIPARVVRSELAKTPGLLPQFAVGAMFVDMRPHQSSQLHSWIAFLQFMDNAAKAKPKSSVSESSKTLSFKETPSLRSADRSVAHQEIQFKEGEKTSSGFMLRFNRGGLLMATSNPLEPNASIQLFLHPSEGEEMEVEGVVVRSSPLKQPFQNLSVAVGVRFSNLSSEHQKKLDQWVSSQPSLQSDIPTPSPEFVWEIMEATPQVLVSMLEKDSKNPNLRWVSQQTDFEKKAFLQQDPQSLCVQQLVLLQAQFGVFHDFIPTILKDPKTFAEPFLGLLGLHLSNAEKVENQTEEFVRQAVKQGREEDRQSLNHVSNLLHEVREQVFVKLADNLSHENLGQGAGVLQTIQEHVKKLRELNKIAPAPVKYLRRAEPPKKQEPKKDKRKKTKRSPTAVIGTSLMLIIGLGVLGWNFLASRVSSRELQIPLSFKKAVQSEEGIEIFCQNMEWKNLVPEKKEETLTKVEAFLSKGKLRQAKFYDEKEKLLAAILSGRSGTKIIYQRRFFDR